MCTEMIIQATAFLMGTFLLVMAVVMYQRTVHSESLLSSKGHSTGVEGCG